MKLTIGLILVLVSMLCAESEAMFDRDQLLSLKESLREQLSDIEEQEARELSEREYERVEGGSDGLDEEQHIDRREDTPVEQEDEVPVEEGQRDELMEEERGELDDGISEETYETIEERRQAKSNRNRTRTGRVCPSCSDGAVCCSSFGGFRCCPKIIRVGDQYVEIDKDKNIVTHFHDDGSVEVVDFSKGLLFTYDKETNNCSVASGLDFTIDDVKAAAENNDTNSGTNNVFKEHYYSKIEGAEPIKDKAMLPEVLRRPCWRRALNWQERVKPSKAKSRELDDDFDKRGYFCYRWPHCRNK